jgi:hypothetical protein
MTIHVTNIDVSNMDGCWVACEPAICCSSAPLQDRRNDSQLLHRVLVLAWMTQHVRDRQISNLKAAVCDADTDLYPEVRRWTSGCLR